MDEQQTEEVVTEIVEESAEESTPESVEESTQEQPAAPDLNMNFDDMGFDAPEEQPATPDYDAVIENIVGKVLEKQKVKAEDDKSSDDDDDMTYLSKRDLAEYEKKIEQKILSKFQEQQEAQRTIQENVGQSEAVRSQYAKKFSEKLTQNGINLEENPHLKQAASMLFDNLKLSYGAQKGRLFVNPQTGAPDAILSPIEMKQLVQQHWQTFSKTYLPGFQAAKPSVATNPLGAGATGSKAEAGGDSTDAYNQFMEKKARGEETLGDALSLLLKSSGKK